MRGGEAAAAATESPSSPEDERKASIASSTSSRRRSTRQEEAEEDSESSIVAPSQHAPLLSAPLAEEDEGGPAAFSSSSSSSSPSSSKDDHDGDPALKSSCNTCAGVDCHCCHPQQQPRQQEMTSSARRRKRIIERNLNSLKRASWQLQQQHPKCTSPATRKHKKETLQMLKEVAHQARLLQNSSNNSKERRTNSKVMLSLSQHSSKQHRQRRDRDSRGWRDLLQRKDDRAAAAASRTRTAAATKIQAGYRMYRCKLVYLRDLLPLSSSTTRKKRRSAQQRKQHVEQDDDDDDLIESKHTLEDVSLHLLMQKFSQHSNTMTPGGIGGGGYVSDLDDSFASLGDIPLSPRTNMEVNNQSLSNSRLWASHSTMTSQSPKLIASPNTIMSGKAPSSNYTSKGTVKTEDATTTNTTVCSSTSMTVTTSTTSNTQYHQCQPMTPPRSALRSSNSSLPVLRVRPAMMPSTFAASTTQRSHPISASMRETRTTTATINNQNKKNRTEAVKMHYSCSSFFVDEDDLKDRPPLERFDASFRRRRTVDIDLNDNDDDDIASYELYPLCSPTSPMVGGGGGTGGCGDTPIKRPNRLPSAHARNSGSDDVDDDDCGCSTSDDVSLDILSFSEDIAPPLSHEEEDSTRWDEQERGRLVNNFDNKNKAVSSSRLHASISGASFSRWSEEPVDMTAFGNMSCMTYFESMGANLITPDTPVKRPSRKQSPMHHTSCPTVGITKKSSLSSSSPPPPSLNKPRFLRRPEPDHDGFDDATSPPAPTRRFSRHFLLQQFQHDPPSWVSGDEQSDSNSNSVLPVDARAAKAPPSHGIGLQRPRRILSDCSSSHDEASASSSLSTGPSLHRRLEQLSVGSPNWPTRKHAVSPSWPTMRKQPMGGTQGAPPPPPPPPPPPRGLRRANTPPASTWSGDSVMAMPTRKQSIETILSSKSGGTTSGSVAGIGGTTITSSSKSSSLSSTLIEQQQQGCSPKCVMDLVDLTTLASSSSTSSSSPTAEAAEEEIEERESEDQVLPSLPATPAPSLLLSEAIRRRHG